MPNKQPVELPDGTLTDTWSLPYLVYCEAKTMAKWTLMERREFLGKLKDEKRVSELKRWLDIIWKNR